MDAIEILKAWLQYAEYDPEQKSFNLLSNNYHLHCCCDNIAKINAYDPSGAMAVLYAKHCFIRMLQEYSVKVFAVISDPGAFSEERAMWNTFHSDEVIALENEILANFSHLIERVIPQKLIGERDLDAEREALFTSVVAVVEELPKCKVELFRRGGELLPITAYSNRIHLYDSLAECLLDLEQASDGLYLCYIRVYDSLDGYFGFFLKSNGNILSINERVDEAYPGQHKHSRNGRYSDDKKYKLFPYSYIFSFSGHDYKGIASKHIIDPEKLGFYHLKPEGYMPLVVAMLMLNTRYANTSTDDLDLHYVNSLLPINVSAPLPGGQALMVPNSSMIAARHNQFEINMTSEGVAGAAYAHHLSSNDDTKGRHYTEYGIFPERENIFVKLYGEGFELVHSKLLEANPHLKRLTSNELAKTELTPDAEFIGSQVRMEVAAYKQAREQLAEYIRDRMFEEYKACGGAPAISQWYTKALRANRKRIFEMCIERYNRPKNWSLKDAKDCGALNIILETDVRNDPSPAGWSWGKCPLNEYHQRRWNGDPDYGKGFKCCINTQTKASIFFSFEVTSWGDIAKIVGMENIPKILKGYVEQGTTGHGNSILYATDAVWEIGTPFEDHEARINRRYWSKHDWENYFWQTQHLFSSEAAPLIPKDTLTHDSTCNFRFSVGFSKRGWAKVLKGEYGFDTTVKEESK